MKFEELKYMQEELFESIYDLLDHIKLVEEDVVKMTKESYMQMSEAFAAMGTPVPDPVLETMQYQDIISQQLSATVEAINSVQKNINFFVHSSKEDATMIRENLKKLNTKLDTAIESAQKKRDAFSGKLGHENEGDEIEFF